MSNTQHDIPSAVYPRGPIANMTEADLVSRAHAQDELAWTELIDRHLPAVWSATQALQLPESAGQQICQLVWLRLAQQLGASPVPLRPWLLHIVESEANRWHRRQSAARNAVVVIEEVPAAG